MVNQKCPKCGSEHIYEQCIKAGMYVSYFRKICKTCDYLGNIERRAD